MLKQQQQNLSVEEAKKYIQDQIQPIKTTEAIPLKAALGRVLAENISSNINVPAHRNSAMDGYAVRYADLNNNSTLRFKILGKSLAGHPYKDSLNTLQCVRITTGASMPEDADTVIIQEDVTVYNDHIETRGHFKKAQNVRQVGEDIKAGQCILTSGKRLSAADIGVLASIGHPKVTVFKKPKITFFMTGDELTELGKTLAPGQIYDSNRYSLHGILEQFAVEIQDMGIIRDEPQAIENALKQASDADMVISTGGVSVGEADYIQPIFEKLGHLAFWKIAMKPGRPLAFGQLGNAHFFGLPGNPVSVMATSYIMVIPALKKLMGIQTTEPLTLQVHCLNDIQRKTGRMDFQRGVLQHDENGVLCVKTTGKQESHLLTSMSSANCFIILPADASNIQMGDLVTVLPFTQIFE